MNWTDWYLVFNGGQTLVGKWDGRQLAPVYEMNTGTKMDPSGQRVMGIQRMMTLPNFIDIPALEMSVFPPHCPIADLSTGVQRELANGIAMAEEMRVKIRAAESGLVVP